MPVKEFTLRLRQMPLQGPSKVGSDGEGRKTGVYVTPERTVVLE